jgi:hypothetical protein
MATYIPRKCGIIKKHAENSRKICSVSWEESPTLAWRWEVLLYNFNPSTKLTALKTVRGSIDIH